MSIEANMTTAVASVANGNIFNGFDPRKLTDTGIFPLVSWALSGPVVPNQTNFIRNPRASFYIWGRTKQQVTDTEEQIIHAIDHTGGLGFTATFIGYRDMDDAETRFYRRVIEFDVWGN